MSRYYRRRYYRGSSKSKKRIQLFFLFIIFVVAFPVFMISLVSLFLFVWLLKSLFQKRSQAEVVEYTGAARSQSFGYTKKRITKPFSYNDDSEVRNYPDFKEELDILSEVELLNQEEKKIDDARKRKERIESLPYRKKNFLMTKAEYNFDKILREAVAGNYEIERQVLLSKLVEPTSENHIDFKTGREFNPDRSKIDKKTIDFVLFNKVGYTPYLAIELDDSSHLRVDRKERDSFVEDVLSSVGIKLVRIKNAYTYNLSEITELIK